MSIEHRGPGVHPLPQPDAFACRRLQAIPNQERFDLVGRASGGCSSAFVARRIVHQESGMRSWKFWVAAAALVALHIWYAVGVWGADLQRQLHDETQAARASRGLAAQSLDDDLCTVCQRHAEWMARRDAMFHGSGENVVAYGTTTAGATVRMWLNSPPHRAFLLGGSSRAGWGAAQSASGRWYWAGAFRGQSTPVVEPAPIVTPVRGFLRIFRRR